MKDIGSGRFNRGELIVVRMQRSRLTLEEKWRSIGSFFYTRADFPHDSWWEQATIRYSDGSTEKISMKKRILPHEFMIEKRKVSWIELCDLIKADDPSPFPALTQIEVYGNDL